MSYKKGRKSEDVLGTTLLASKWTLPGVSSNMGDQSASLSVSLVAMLTLKRLPLLVYRHMAIQVGFL